MFRPYTPLGLKWEWKQSYYWVPFVCTPFSSFLAFLYVGLQMKNRSWLFLSLLHFSLVSVSFGYMYVTNYAEDPVLFFVIASGFVWLNAIGNMRRVRADYVKFLYETMEPKERERLAKKERKRREEKAQRTLQERAPEVIASEDARKRQLERTLYIAREERRKRESGVTFVHINEASVEELARLPGLNGIMARGIMNNREDGPFRSFDDLVDRTGIRAHVLEEAAPFIVYSREELAEKELENCRRKEAEQEVEKVGGQVVTRTHDVDVNWGRVVDMEKEISIGEREDVPAADKMVKKEKYSDTEKVVREKLPSDTEKGEKDMYFGADPMKKDGRTSKEEEKKETFGRRVDL